MRWTTNNEKNSLSFEEQLDCVGCKKHLYKCCAFQPFIPNFLCGDWDARSHNYHLTPLGLIATQEYQRKYKGGLHSKEMVCVNFETSSGQCRRWNQRPSECTAYHCESKNGDEGLKVWSQLAQRWHQLECDVAQMAMLEFGYDHHEIAMQLEWITKPPTIAQPTDLEKIWSHYKNREVEYYSQCAKWASTLTQEQVRNF